MRGRPAAQDERGSFPRGSPTQPEESPLEYSIIVEPFSSSTRIRDFVPPLARRIARPRTSFESPPRPRSGARRTSFRMRFAVPNGFLARSASTAGETRHASPTPWRMPLEVDQNRSTYGSPPVKREETIRITRGSPDARGTPFTARRDAAGPARTARNRPEHVGDPAPPAGSATPSRKIFGWRSGRSSQRADGGGRSRTAYCWAWGRNTGQPRRAAGTRSMS